MPGAHRVLWWHLPAEAVPTAEGLRRSSLRFLKDELPKHIASDVRNFVDGGDDSLPRRVRLLGTSVTPTIFALVGHDAEDVLELWALPKFDALARLEARFPKAVGPALARLFYQNVGRLYGDDFDADLGRETFRTGVAFLRWAERVAEALPPPQPASPNAT